MKTKMTFLRVLALILTFTALVSQSPLARAADSTSFDPTLVEVTAKSVSGYPIGFVAICPVAKCPEEDEMTKDGHLKWLECNGQAINPTVYPELAAAYGATVPDFRGLFLRGHGAQTFNSGGYGNVSHSSDNLGAVQGDAIRNISARMVVDDDMLGYVSGAFRFSGSRIGWDWDSGRDDYAGGYIDFNSSNVVPTANENRPINMAVRYLIRAVK